MSHFKLKLGLCFIPVFGFFMVLLWGMISTYSIYRKRLHAFVYGFICAVASFITAIILAIIWKFLFSFFDHSNTALFIGIALAIGVVWLYLLSGISLAAQYFYCKKLISKQSENT